MNKSMTYFSRLTKGQWLLLGWGLLIGLALYQFVNGFYAGIIFELGQ